MKIAFIDGDEWKDTTKENPQTLREMKQRKSDTIFILHVLHTQIARERRTQRDHSLLKCKINADNCCHVQSQNT